MKPDAGSWRALVVDDEPMAREAVRMLLRDQPDVELVGEAASGEEAVRAARALGPDLMFLDVQMPDLDGFQVLEALGRDVPRAVVFVTAFDQHALRAFEVHALDYVVKPFGRPRFLAAVARAVERLREQEGAVWQRTLASLLRSQQAGAAPAGLLAASAAAASSTSRRLALRKGACVVLVPLGDVDWVEADGDYVRVHAGEQAHFVAARLQALEGQLDAGLFVRIHRSVIVNLSRVRELQRDESGGGTLLLRNDVRLRVSRTRWEALESALGLP